MAGLNAVQLALLQDAVQGLLEAEARLFSTEVVYVSLQAGLILRARHVLADASGEPGNSGLQEGL